MEKELTLLDYWRIIWKYRWLIAGLFAGFLIFSLLFSLRQPATYRATASILPSAGAGEDTPSSYRMMMYYGMMSHGDIFVSMLKSRTIHDEVAKQVKEMETGGMGAVEYENGENRIFVPAPRVDVSNENIINISVVDTDPERAAKIANLYVKTLDLLYMRLNIREAGQKRRFIEERLKETEQSLREAENRIEEYSRKHNIAGARYSSGISAGGLESQIMAKKVELEAKKEYATCLNPEIMQLEKEIAEMEKAVASLPAVENEMARLIRDLKVQENIYQLLITQYEQVKIEEVRDIPVVQVLDWAVPPRGEDGPGLKRNMVIAGLAALFLGALLAFFLDYINIQKQSDRS